MLRVGINCATEAGIFLFALLSPKRAAV